MTLNHSHSASSFGLGPAAFLANGILVYAILAWLAHSAANPFDRTLLLAGGNLGLACALFVPRVRNGRLLLNRTTTAALVGWSIAYSLIYGSFVRWPDLVPVWSLVAAQACAPLVAVFVSGDHSRDTASFGTRIVVSSPIVFLLCMAFLEWRSSRRITIAPLIAAALVLSFAFSQSCARIVARNAPNAFWAPPRLAFLNGLILFTFWAVAGRGEVGITGFVLLCNIVLLSVGIFAVQALYLFALAKTAPFLSATLLSAVVPIAIFGDFLLKRSPSHSRLSLWLSLGFSLATGLATWVTSEKARVEVTPTLLLEAE